MSVPLRKEKLDEELTTADLAQGKRPVAAEELRPQAVHPDVSPTERAVSATEDNAPLDFPRQEVRSQEIRNQDIRSQQEVAPLFPQEELVDLRKRWQEVQVTCVDEPRRAVEQADGLVASAMKRLAEVFAEERASLETQWDRGDNVSTEDLRIALQRYRSFFHRLLSI